MSFAFANAGDVNVTGLGMFAYNVVEPAVTAQISNVHLTGANTVAVTALQQSELTATLRGVSVDVAGSSAGYAWTIAPVVQVAINFDGGQTEAGIFQSQVTPTDENQPTGETTVTATRNPTLIAKAGAVQFGLALASTVGVSGGLVWTTVANNPDRASTTKKTSKKEGWTDGGATAAVDSSTIEATRIAVVATETPRYETHVLQVEADIAVGATFALAVSVGMVRSVNRLYDTVEATVSNSTLTATTGDIAVKATLARYQDPTTTDEDFNIEAHLRSYSIALSIGPYVGAGAGVGCKSDITVQSKISATVTDSPLQGATEISVAALDDLSSRNHWNSVEVAAALGAGLSVTMAFPSLNTNIGNTVDAQISVVSPQSSDPNSDSDSPPASETQSTTVSTTSGDVTVTAESRTRALQDLKTVSFTFGLIGFSLTKPNLNTRFTSTVTAEVSGSSDTSDSLTIEAPAGDLRVTARYAGAGPGALENTVDDLGILVASLGGIVDYTWMTIDAKPGLTAALTGGTTATARDEIAVQAFADGRLVGDSKQWIGVAIGVASAADFLGVLAQPSLTSQVGDDDAGRALLQARHIRVTAESLLDGTGRSHLASYGIIALATVLSETTATVQPTIDVILGSSARLQATEAISLNAVGGKNTLPPPRDFSTSNVDLDANTIDFQTYTSLHYNDRMKYDVGLDDKGNPQTLIGGLTDQTVYHVFPVNESTIQLGEEFDARVVNTNTDRLRFAEATAFRGPFELSDWGPSYWDQVIYDVPAGTPVGGLTKGKTYYVNKMSDTVVMLIDRDAYSSNPLAPPTAINNSSFSTVDNVTTFSIKNHGFNDGQVVSYVAPVPVTLNSDQVGTATTLQVEGGELGVFPAADSKNDFAIFVGDRIDQFVDGDQYTYHAGDALGDWYWAQTDEQKKWKVVGATGNFWDGAEQTEVNDAYVNWADGNPRSSQDGGGNFLQIDAGGLWSNPAPSTTLNYYVLETPVFVYKDYTDLGSKDHGWIELRNKAKDQQMWLPSITSGAELLDLRTVMSGNNLEYAFLGGTDDGHKDTWVWETSDLDPDNGVQFWQGLNDGYNTGSLTSPWATNEPNDRSKKTPPEPHLENKEERLVAQYDSTTKQITWNDDKKGYDSLHSAATGYVFERMRYQLIKATDGSVWTVDAARSHAATNGGWLATIGSQEDNDAIQALFEAQGVTEPAWIGGQRQTGIAGLTDGDTYTVEVLSDQDYNNFGVTPLSPTISSTIVGNTFQNNYLVMTGDPNQGTLTAVDGTTTSIGTTTPIYYVLAQPGSPTSYTLQKDQPRTFAEAVQHATFQGGWVAFVQDNSTSAFNTARGNNSVWLNASDSAAEGTWRYASGTSGHAQSIRLKDANGDVVPVQKPSSGFYTFTLSTVGETQIEGLQDAATYTVKKIDDNHFQLQTPDADGQLQPVVLPSPTDPTGGQGSWLGTLGVNLTTTGTGTHRLILVLTSAPPGQTQHLDFQSHAGLSKSVGTGTATAIGMGHTGAVEAFSIVLTTATSRPVATITLGSGSELQAVGGKISLLSDAYGNAVSSAVAGAGGLVATTMADAEIVLSQQSTITVLGNRQANMISIEAHVGGHASNRSMASSGGVFAYSRANARVDEQFEAQVDVGSSMSGDPATVLRADTHLSVKADLGGLAIG
ncbi:MAG: C-type lectin domain-containing protein, partial [Planctomycetaceae bacterium]